MNEEMTNRKRIFGCYNKKNTLNYVKKRELSFSFLILFSLTGKEIQGINTLIVP